MNISVLASPHVQVVLKSSNRWPGTDPALELSETRDLPGDAPVLEGEGSTLKPCPSVVEIGGMKVAMVGKARFSKMKDSHSK